MNLNSVTKVVGGRYVYSKENLLGSGTYGKVYKAIDNETGHTVALKKTRSSITYIEEGIPPTTIREIDFLYMLSEHPNIVKLLAVENGVSRHLKPLLFLVFEYMTSDLKKFIKNHQKRETEIPLLMIKKLMYQLLNGVAHCHSNGILHRDLKPENLLLNETNDLKIGDFGLGRGYRDAHRIYTQPVVTLWYRAPELLLGAKHYNGAVDVWAVGCIFAELYRRCPLFQSSSELEQIKEIFCLLGTPNEEVWPGVTQLEDWHIYPKWQAGGLAMEVPGIDERGLNLLSQMLEYDPMKRITPKRAILHPYFSELHERNEHS